MRVTESRMMQLASQHMSQAQSRVAETADAVASGIRVNKPSDDPTAWAAAERAKARETSSAARGTAIGRAKSQLQASDGALGSIQSAIARARELANQMANGTLDANQRSAAAVEVQALRDTVLSSANSVDGDGLHLFSGSAGTTTPFTLAAYNGDGANRQLQINEMLSVRVRLNGLVLTGASGVDIIGVLDTLSTDLSANNVAGVQTGLTDLATATTQVSNARGTVGAELSTLNSADDARQAFEEQLSKDQAANIGADPVQAASALAQAKNALEATQTVAQLITSLTQTKF
jgi:flagellar hook-associated protein 3 FlgL